MGRKIAAQATLGVALLLNLALVILSYTAISAAPVTMPGITSNLSRPNQASLTPARKITRNHVDRSPTSSYYVLLLSGISLVSLLAVTGILLFPETTKPPVATANSKPIISPSAPTDSHFATTPFRNSSSSYTETSGKADPPPALLLPEGLSPAQTSGAAARQSVSSKAEWLPLARECVSLFDEVERVPSLDRPFANHVCARLQEMLERVGVETIDHAETFDRSRHQLAQPTHLPTQGARIASVTSPGFAAQGQVLRRACVHLAD